MEPNPAIESACALLGGLVAEGVTTLVACPGARSAPLAWASRSAGLRVFVQHDERAAGFLALGIARTSGAPVALSCTSGSALANFAPAIVEAQAARLPLIVISADRPSELHGCDAPQTMPQAGALRAWTVAAHALAPAGQGQAEVWGAAGVEAAREARSLAGPVHINAPFREPLHPTGVERMTAPSLSPAPDITQSSDRELVAGTHLGASRRPVVLLGPWSVRASETAKVVSVCRRAGIPVLADPLSGARSLPAADGVLAAFDAVLRDDRARSVLRPDLIVRLGAPMTSKATQQWVARTPQCRVEVWSEGARWNDPADRPIVRLPATGADLIALLDHAPPSVQDGWRDAWVQADRAAGAAIAMVIDRHDSSTPPLELRTMAAVAAACAPQDLLHVASSMPVRLADTGIAAGGCAARIYSNRGVNGIDGTLATAAGEWLGSDRSGRVWVVVGDVAMIHDMTGLMAAMQHDVPMTVVVLNNDGGGIFHHLPLADRSETFEQFFGTPHGLTFAAAAAQFGFVYRRLEPFEVGGEPAALRAEPARRILLEVGSDRQSEVDALRELWRAATAAARAALPESRDD